MSWESLKSAVSAVITDNLNNEITGNILRQLLNNNIIPKLGAGKYMGIATPTTMPSGQDGEIFYIAKEQGVYSNFGGLVVNLGITMLINKDGIWEADELFNADAIAGVTVTGFIGDLTISQTPVKDGLYIAKEQGTYVNAGGLVISLVNKIAFIVVGSSQTYFSKIEIDVTGKKEVYIEDYGAVGDGVTDDSSALISALTALKPTGGKLKFQAKTYLITQQITLPDDGASTNPKLAPIIWEGVGAMHTGRGTAPIGGTRLDLTYSHPTNDYGKIMCLGLGLWQISGITFTDSGSSSTAFIYNTNTTILAQNNGFYGNKNGILADQDAFVMGGTEDVEGFRGVDDGFQGYGTVIQNNYFGQIRRALYGRVYFNGNVFRDNIIWNTCGSNLTNGACIEIDGDPLNKTVQKAVGNVISNNLIESTHYPYPIKLIESEKNTIFCNNFYDPSVTTLAYHYLDVTAGWNYIVSGFKDDNYAFVTGSGADDSMIINTGQNQPSYYNTPQWFKDLYTLSSTTTNDKLKWQNSAGDQFYKRLLGSNRVFNIIKPNGLSEVELDEIRDYGGGVIQHLIKGTDSRLDSDGKLRVRSGGASSELWLGDTTRENLYIIDGYLYTNRDSTTDKIQGIKADTTANRPTGMSVGTEYFDTTLQKPIWYNGSVWKDATGTTV